MDASRFLCRGQKTTPNHPAVRGSPQPRSPPGTRPARAARPGSGQRRRRMQGTHEAGQRPSPLPGGDTGPSQGGRVGDPEPGQIVTERTAACPSASCTFFLSRLWRQVGRGGTSGAGSLMPTSWHAAQESRCPQLHAQRGVSGGPTTPQATRAQPWWLTAALITQPVPEPRGWPAVALPLRVRSGGPRARAGPADGCSEAPRVSRARVTGLCAVALGWPIRSPPARPQTADQGVAVHVQGAVGGSVRELGKGDRGLIARRRAHRLPGWRSAKGTGA